MRIAEVQQAVGQLMDQYSSPLCRIKRTTQHNVRTLLLGIPLSIASVPSLDPDALPGSKCAQLLLQVPSIASTARGQVGKRFPVRLGKVEDVNHLEPQVCFFDRNQTVPIGCLLPL